MNTFLAIIFVCATGTPVEVCDETRAIEVRSVRVDNELGCTNGWQEIIARTPAATEPNQGTYLKTACRRQRR